MPHRAHYQHVRFGIGRGSQKPFQNAAATALQGHEARLAAMAGEQMVVAKGGTPSVTLIGEPLELVLRLYGRHECVVDVEGPEEAVARFESARFGV